MKNTPAPITVLDLFAGAGGFTAGLHKASSRFRTVRAVEMDSAAAASFAATFGARVVTNSSIEHWLATDEVPEVDVVIGGPPCQGFSTLGLQDAEDDRNALWEQYAQAVVRAKPKYFVLENVAAFARSSQFQDLTRSTEAGGLLSDYSFEHRILNAADYGAFQARKRAVVIGYHNSVGNPGFPQPTHAGRHRTVREAFAAISAPPSGSSLPERSTSYGEQIFPGLFTSDELHIGRDYRDLSLRRFESIPLGGNRFDLPDHLLAPCWRSHRSGSGDVMGRLHWNRPSVTIRTEFFKPEKGRYLHPEEHRAITHYEASLLQGFGPKHQFAGSKTAIARQIGNAVPIPLGAAIGRHLELRLR